MNNQEIIEQVKKDYEVVLEEFVVYDTPQELFECEKANGNLSEYTIETNGRELGEEENVFEVKGKWIYAPKWYDAEWDD